MRVASVLRLLGLFVLASGCGSRQEAGMSRGPLFAGKLEGGTFWTNPLTATGNEGRYEKASRAEVSDKFVVATTAGGLSHVHPHGYDCGLVIKKSGPPNEKDRRSAQPNATPDRGPYSDFSAFTVVAAGCDR